MKSMNMKEPELENSKSEMPEYEEFKSEETKSEIVCILKYPENEDQQHLKESVPERACI